MQASDTRARCKVWLEPQPCFIPGLKGAQARDGARGHGPPPVGKQHGLYVDGVRQPVSTRSALDR